MATAVTSSMVQASFDALEKQRELINTCTVLWKELNDHFSSLEQNLEAKSESLRSKRRLLEVRTQRTLDSLRRREISIESSVDLAISTLEKRRAAAMDADSVSDLADLAEKLKSLCAKMDSSGFLALVLSKRKEAEILRLEVPSALEKCVDPARFVVDAVSVVFPMDKREVKSPTDVAWACVLVLESLEPVLADPELGLARPLVPRGMRERAREMADAWKEGLELRGGLESAKPPDAHAFLQLVVTFGIVMKEEKGLYRKIVVSFSWRRQMPKLALAVGLEDEMDDIIEELIAKGQQLDAVNFAYESGLQGKYPPVPLLKAFLEDSTKSLSYSPDNNQGHTTNNYASRREQSALRSVIKCIEDRKLETEFPLSNLHKRLETLEKAKLDKKKPNPNTTSPNSSPTNTITGTGTNTSSPITGPANKRIRANHGGPMPPAKAGRLTTNAYVSAGPTFIRSPSSHNSYPVPTSPYQSPTANPYVYPTADVASPGIAMSYPSPPMSYTHYAGYNNGYNGGLAPPPGFHYYR